MKNSQKGFVGAILLVIIGVLVVGGGVYFYSQNKSVSTTAPINDVSNNAKNSNAFYDSDLRISHASISVSNNSASAFNAVKTNLVAKADSDFLSKYFANYSAKNLPPITQSQKILTAHTDLLNIFDANANKQYQCSIGIGENCSLQPIRNIANLAALRSLVAFQQNKPSEAQSTALNIVTLGKNVTANADAVITLLVGWSVQNLGYNILATVQPKGTLSANEKANLIATLRQEHKKALRYEYTRTAEGIDYITSPANKPSAIITSDEEETIAIYRKGATASPTAWNPTETKKYFYDSYKIALSNIDLACGVTPKTSVMNLNFDPQNEQTENYVGKTMYSTTYASLDTMSQKRCAIENLIQNL